MVKTSFWGVVDALVCFNYTTTGGFYKDFLLILSVNMRFFGNGNRLNIKNIKEDFL